MFDFLTNWKQLRYQSQWLLCIVCTHVHTRVRSITEGATSDHHPNDLFSALEIWGIGRHPKTFCGREITYKLNKIRIPKKQFSNRSFVLNSIDPETVDVEEVHEELKEVLGGPLKNIWQQSIYFFLLWLKIYTFFSLWVHASHSQWSDIIVIISVWRRMKHSTTTLLRVSPGFSLALASLVVWKAAQFHK